jgi:hypothetical protein
MKWERSEERYKINVIIRKILTIQRGRESNNKKRITKEIHVTKNLERNQSIDATKMKKGLNKIF